MKGLLIKKKKKRINKKKNYKPLIIVIIIGALTGGALGVFSRIYFPQGLLKGESGIISLLNFYIYFIIVIVGYLLHIIIHEAGHLVFGLITGYKFVSFRVGSLTLIKENNKFKFKKFNIPGTAGQCLLMPPEIIDGVYPFVIYNLGGAIFNLIVSIITIYIGMKMQGESLLKGILVFSGFGGLIAALTNAIPFKIGGIPNDGYNILTMLKDEEIRRAFHSQLLVNGLQSQGERIKDMDIGIFDLSEEADLSSPLNTAVVLMRHNYYLDNLDFQGAKEALDSLVPYIDKVVSLYKFEINIERMFLDLIGENNKEFIDDLYDRDIKKYIKAAKYMLGKKRFMMAYEGFYNNDKEKALEYYEELKDLYNHYPVKGEAEMELMLGKLVKEKLEI